MENEQKVASLPAILRPQLKNSIVSKTTPDTRCFTPFSMAWQIFISQHFDTRNMKDS
jgi:hypothetical protein